MRSITSTGAFASAPAIRRRVAAAAAESESAGIFQSGSAPLHRWCVISPVMNARSPCDVISHRHVAGRMPAVDTSRTASQSLWSDSTKSASPASTIGRTAASNVTANAPRSVELDQCSHSARANR
jgi:hypothetical protein